MNRRYGEPLKRDLSYRRRPGVYALLPDNAGQILVTFQNHPVPEFQLPGGGVDPGEQPIPALHREVFEETGWKIAAPRVFTTYRRFTYMPEYEFWAEKVCTIYIATPVRPLGPPREAGHRAVWLDQEAALDLLGGAGDRAVLARALGLSR